MACCRAQELSSHTFPPVTAAADLPQPQSRIPLAVVLPTPSVSQGNPQLALLPRTRGIAGPRRVSLDARVPLTDNALLPEVEVADFPLAKGHPMSNASSPPLLKTIDSVVADVLTDDVSDGYVTKTPYAVSEFTNVILAGAEEISGPTLLCANLGYGLRLVTQAGETRHTLLFDTGPEAAIYLRNCANLAIPLKEVEAIAATHGHWDHMAALPETIDAIVAAGGKVTVHTSPNMFVERGVKLKSGRIVPVGKVPSAKTIEARGAKLVNDPNERLLLDGHFYYSGEIPRVTSFEKGRSDHMLRTGPDAPWQPDPFLMDERFVVVHVRDLGLIVFSACSHGGIVNVCIHVRNRFPHIPIYAVMGGLHLGGVMERIIPDTIEALRPFRIPQIIAGHCTGWKALVALASAFPDAVSQSAVGTRYTFDESHHLSL
jgi:7,8-dihydropterin-6-yl-methyl-4-(beta-D-ribofuranosyl)aminobenzene 5'-phosphate synthase